MTIFKISFKFAEDVEDESLQFNFKFSSGGIKNLIRITENKKHIKEVWPEFINSMYIGACCSISYAYQDGGISIITSEGVTTFYISYRMNAFGLSKFVIPNSICYPEFQRISKIFNMNVCKQEK